MMERSHEIWSKNRPYKNMDLLKRGSSEWSQCTLLVLGHPLSVTSSPGSGKFGSCLTKARVDWCFLTSLIRARVSSWPLRIQHQTGSQILQETSQPLPQSQIFSADQNKLSLSEYRDRRYEGHICFYCLHPISCLLWY